MKQSCPHSFIHSFIHLIHHISDSIGIGAGIDSFYEYLFKAYVLFGDDTFLNMFNEVSNNNSIPITITIAVKFVQIMYCIDLVPVLWRGDEAFESGSLVL